MIGHCPNCGKLFSSTGEVLSVSEMMAQYVVCAICDECRTPGSLRCYSCGRALDGGYIIGGDKQRRCVECHMTADANREAYAARQLFVGEIARMLHALKVRQRELILLRARRDFEVTR